MRVTMYGLLHPYLGADCCARLSVCRLIIQRASGLADSATAPSLLAISPSLSVSSTPDPVCLPRSRDLKARSHLNRPGDRSEQIESDIV